jgi:hypothetical protein
VWIRDSHARCRGQFIRDECLGSLTFSLAVLTPRQASFWLTNSQRQASTKSTTILMQDGTAAPRVVTALERPATGRGRGDQIQDQ